MSKTAIFCFSRNNENLNLIIYELNRYYGSEIKLTVFKKELSLLESLKNCNFSEQEKQLIVLDIDICNCETIQFINNINNFSPTANKLIIADEYQRLQIQKFAKNTDLVIFLDRPWNSNKINNALNNATKPCPELSVSSNNKGIALSFDKLVEEKVNERFHKLIDANLAKDSFLSIIAHDLKSPFFALLGISEILLNEWDTLTDKTKIELIGDLHKTSDDTYKLLVTLLDWSKLQKEKLEVCIQEVNIYNLVNSTLKISENNASVKGIKVENKINIDMKVKTDTNMISTVFRNLISNAVQYTQPGGTINITAQEENNFCRFCVEDNGIGIDKPHILDMFKKGSEKQLNGNANSFKGLGLIISKDFVEKNGGQIWLETQIGLGSKFFFTVPVS